MVVDICQSWGAILDKKGNLTLECSHCPCMSWCVSVHIIEYMNAVSPSIRMCPCVSTLSKGWGLQGEIRSGGEIMGEEISWERGKRRTRERERGKGEPTDLHKGTR